MILPSCRYPDHSAGPFARRLSRRRALALALPGAGTAFHGITPWAGSLRHGPGTPAEATPSASSRSLEAILVSCRTTPATEIPGAEPYFAGFGLGRAPVWLVGWGGALEGTPTSDAGGAATPMPVSLLVLSDVERLEPYGWPMKALWVIAYGHDTPVQVEGCDCATNRRIWFQFGGAEPEQRATLDPLNPGIPVQHGSWREFPSSVVFPETGCYEITATWGDGSWSARIPVFVETTEEE